MGINLTKILRENSKFLLSILDLDKSGNKNALKLLDKIVNFPVNCWGIEYNAKATGPKKNLIKYLSNKS